MADALFERDGDLYLPTGLTRGPWDPGAMNGGAAAALVARAAEQHDDEGAPILPDQLLARMTIDLVRPAPLTPLAVRTTTVRPGRKIQLVEVLVAADDRVVTRALVLRMPAARHELEPTPVAPPPGPDEVDDYGGRRPADHEVFHADAVEMRARRSEAGGAATIWVRMRVPVVADEELSPAVRAAVTADFGSGMSGAAPSGYRSINTDISLHLFRDPIGEWLCYDAVSHLGSGVALAGGGLHDRAGLAGHVTQTVLVEPWEWSSEPR